jgi:UDP-N-acetylmuramoylalanine--D-glutamate ligase
MASLVNNSAQQSILYPGIKVLVVGLGQTGLAAIEFFKKCGARVSVSESTPKTKINTKTLEILKKQGVYLESGGHTVDFFQSADLIFVSPGIPLDLEPLAAARNLSIPVVGEMAIVAQYIKTPVVAVTGTNGKTTVTTLLGELFKADGKKVFVGGNIGTPLFEYIAGPQDADVVVAEISSFQLDTGGDAKGLYPEIALLLNITPDHLERYASFEAYGAAKFKIFAAQGNNDIAILNADDNEIMNRRQLWPSSRKYFFGKNLEGFSGAAMHGKSIRLSEADQAEDSLLSADESYDLAGTSLEASPNLQNAAAAILAARLFGCSSDSIKQGLRQFIPLEHRMSLLTEINGVKFYDDSKATNVGAVYSALSSLESPIILIAGGRDKGGKYSMLNDLIQQKVKNLLLIGEAKEKMARALAPFTSVETFDSLEEAVSRAADIATPGDAVLLSPACASFDMFKNYAARGDYFKKSVFEIKAATEMKNNPSLTH